MAHEMAKVFILRANSEQLRRTLDYSTEHPECIVTKTAKKKKSVSNADPGKAVTKTLAVPTLVL